jgi:hypothetical protein
LLVDVDQSLRELGIDVPDPLEPGGYCVPAMAAGDLVYRVRSRTAGRTARRPRAIGRAAASCRPAGRARSDDRSDRVVRGRWCHGRQVRAPRLRCRAVYDVRGVLDRLNLSDRLSDSQEVGSGERPIRIETSSVRTSFAVDGGRHGQSCTEPVSEGRHGPYAHGWESAAADIDGGLDSSRATGRQAVETQAERLQGHKSRPVADADRRHLEPPADVGQWRASLGSSSVTAGVQPPPARGNP